MAQSNPEMNFPFFQINDVEKVFGEVREMKRTIEECPPEFRKRENEWWQCAAHAHTYGWAGFIFDNIGVIAESKEEIVAKRDYIEAWLKNFNASTEDKYAVVGWLMSQTFSSLPPMVKPPTIRGGHFIDR